MSSIDTGIALNDQFDFEIDETGDVAATSDVDELQKDLSGGITALLDGQFIGEVLTETDIAEIESVLRSNIVDDFRVLEVRSISVRQSRRDRDTVIIDISAISIYGTLSFQLGV